VRDGPALQAHTDADGQGADTIEAGIRADTLTQVRE